jgi:hypothetical protein
MVPSFDYIVADLKLQFGEYPCDSTQEWQCDIALAIVDATPYTLR